MGDKLTEIIKRTNKADPSRADQRALTQYIVEGGRDEIARMGQLHRLVITKIESAFSNHLLTTAADERMAEMEREFGYETASPLERLLIDNILVTWLRYHLVEFLYTEVQKESSQRALLWERRLSLSHRRYLRSIEALAKVRRLLYKPENKLAFNLLLKQQLANDSGGKHR